MRMVWEDEEEERSGFIARTSNNGSSLGKGVVRGNGKGLEFR
jgi:hypothetical protein